MFLVEVTILEQNPGFCLCFSSIFGFLEIQCLCDLIFPVCGAGLELVILGMLARVSTLSEFCFPSPTFP